VFGILRFHFKVYVLDVTLKITHIYNYYETHIILLFLLLVRDLEKKNNLLEIAHDHLFKRIILSYFLSNWL